MQSKWSFFLITALHLPVIANQFIIKDLHIQEVTSVAPSSCQCTCSVLPVYLIMHAQITLYTDWGLRTSLAE